MSKRKTINELTNVLSVALRHKIGSIVNNNEVYASKYAKDADLLLKEAQKISLKENWNSFDKKEIRDKLKIKLIAELKSKDFIDGRKFDFVDEEIKRALALLKLTD